MPRTTLDIDASVLRELKRRQAKEQKTLGQLVSELLGRALAAEPAPQTPLEWVSKDLKPLVDLDDKELIWKILDER